MTKNIQKKSFLCTLLLMQSIFMLQVQSQNPVGAIPGVIDVSPMGAATYTIPIEVVPGTQGVQPNLSIVYNSFGGMGLLGMKWNLTGLSAITRCAPIPLFEGDDAHPKPIDFSSYRFSLDGVRLVNVGNYGNPIWAPEVENFTRIYPITINNQPSFIAYTDDGSVVRYGSTPNSRQLMANTLNILSWLVDTIRDFNGNYMSFQYTKPNQDEEVLIQEIKYTGNYKKPNEMQPYATVNFEYTPLGDMLGKNTYFVDGYKVQQTKLLKSISIYYYNTPTDATLVRKYVFNYENNSQHRYAHLKEIVLYGEGGTQQLNATTIKWNPQSSLATYGNVPKAIDKDKFPIGDIITGDFNGDGLTDYAIYNQGGIRSEFYSRQPDGTFVTTGGGQHPSGSLFYKADLEGKGSEQLIILELLDEETKHYECNLFGDKRQFKNFSELFLGDFDGDGKTDILFVTKEPTNNNFKCTFTMFSLSDYNKGFRDFKGLTKYTDCKVRVGDFSGNGKTDIEIHNKDGNNSTIELYWFNNNIWQFERLFKPSDLPPTANFQSERYSGDFNGDGITDLLTFEKGIGWELYFAKGNGTYTKATNITSAYGLIGISNDDYSPVYKITIADFDGDGKDDILQREGNNVRILYSKGCITDILGSTYKYKYETASITNCASPNPKYIVSDFNNDGYLDMIVQCNPQHQPAVIYFNTLKYEYPETITDGLGKIVKIEYKPAYLTANSFNMSQNIRRKYFHNLVDKITTSNGLGGYKVLEYTFDLPVFSMRRKAFLGFKGVNCINAEEEKREHSEYEFHGSYGNFDNRDVLALSIQQTFYRDTDYYAIDYKPGVYVMGNRYMMRTAPQTRQKLLGIEIDNTRNIYDNNGRLEKSLTITSTNYFENSKDMVKSLKVFVTKDYTYKSIDLNSSGTQKKSVVEKIITTTTYTSSGPTEVIDTLTYNYAETGTNAGRLNWERQGNCYGVITTKYEDYLKTGVYGSKTVLAKNCDPRIEIYEYDGTQRFVKKITNPEGHTTEYAYDAKTGNKTLEKDPNGLSTTFQYDKFGNLTQIKYPDNTKTNISKHWQTATNPPHAKYYVTTTSTGKPDVSVYYDVLGREVCRKDNGYYYQTVYNKKGQLEKTSGPFITFPPQRTYWHYYTYDKYGRKKSETAPYLDIKYDYYHTETEVTDLLRKNTKTWKDYDVIGRIEITKDAGGKVTYDYMYEEINKKTRLKTTIYTNTSVDDNTPITSETIIISDLWGNRLSIEDADAGLIQSSYNGFNELVKQIDARGDTTTYQYDKLGRVTQKRFADKEKNSQTLTYTYDKGDNAIGKLSQIDIDGTEAETFTYDNYSRLSEHTKTIDNTPYSHKYTYTENGQIETLTYPDNFAVTYKYNPTGKLSAILRNDTDSLIYSVKSRNAYNAPILCSYGNSLATQYSYNATGLPLHIHTGNKTILFDTTEPDTISGTIIIDRGGEIIFEVDSNILNYRYAYDDKGLMTTRSEKVINCAEEFTYDNLDRLIMFTSRKIGERPYQRTFSYAKNGNIAESSNGIYSYNNDKKPHAVRQISNSSSILSQTVTYNFYNQPTSIKEGVHQIDLFYGTDQQRQKMVTSKNGAEENTRLYVSKNYEEVKDATTGYQSYYHYIYGDNGAVALHIFTPRLKIDSMYYIHTDHLGSFCAITSQTKHVAQRYRFDAWGNHHEPASSFSLNDSTTYHQGDSLYLPPPEHIGITALPFPITTRGFTGHEHYPQLKTINMNARLYDPVIGRFFSPDNFVQMPEFTQGFNRYSYALNCPLKYVDPSGNTVVIPNENDRKFINGLIDPQSKNYSNSYHTLYQKLDASDREYSFKSWKYDATRKYDGLLSFDPNNPSKATINFTMDDNPDINNKTIGASKYRVLFEETFHAGQLETFGDSDNSAISEAKAWKFSATAPETKYSFFDKGKDAWVSTVMGQINKNSILGVALMFKFGYSPNEGVPVPAMYKDFPLNNGIEKNFSPLNR